MNGYFQLVVVPNGTGVKVFAPTEGGTAITVSDIRDYLDQRSMTYDVVKLDEAVQKPDGSAVLFNSQQVMPERESYRLTVSDDGMTATAYFYPPSDGTKGEEMTADEVKKDLKFKSITYGVLDANIDAYFAKRTYCTEIVLAQGKPVREGKDAHIEYLFNTSTSAKPQMKEDGTVDFFSLDLISHCQEGDVLAKLTPEDPGEDGWNIFDKPVTPKKVQVLKLKGNKNCTISEDGLTMSAAVNGHVSLYNSEVSVSNVYTVQGVDASTGNIEYEGSVVVNGDVESGFSVKANGDVEVKGSVGAASIRAKGNVVLVRGMNGGTSGEIVAGGNVVTKFLEGANVKAGGSVSAESIMRSTVQAGTEVYVDGKRGFIAGGIIKEINYGP